MLPADAHQENAGPSRPNEHAYGLRVSIFEPLGRDEALAAIARAGFSAVELYVGDGLFGNWTEDPDAMRQALDRAALMPWSVHAPGPGCDLANDDEQARLTAVEAMRMTFRAARDLGAEVVICHPNAPKKPFPPDDYQSGLARSRQSLELLAEDADRVGIRMAVENMIPRPEKRPCTGVGDILGLIEGLGDHVGVCLDTGHNHVACGKVDEETLLAGDKLFSVHMHDNHGVFDQDEHLLPGQGTIEWDAFLAALERISFDAPRIFEVNLLPGPDAQKKTLAELVKVVANWRS